jgi:hypothetical protein
MSEFKPGDVVMLRCGGPMMVVARLDEPRPTPPANAGWGYGDLDPYRPGPCVRLLDGAGRVAMGALPGRGATVGRC